jgi:hypothetical protein
MSEEKRSIQGKLEVAGLVGPLWFMGWLFTIGFTDLNVSRAIFAVVLWPYFLGRALA